MTEGPSTRSRQGAPKQPDTVRQTIVETIEAPRLTGVSTSDFVEFRKKREIYERRVSEKNSDSNIKMQLTSYKDSIDKPILQLFTLGNWVPVDSVEEVTEDHLRKCVEERSRVSPEDFDIARIEDELKDVRLERADSKTSLQTQVWNLCLKYNTLLQDLGYEGFTDKHPKLAVKHLLKRVTHPFLKNRMLMLCETKKKEEFQENFTQFVRELAKEAQKIDYLNAAKRFAPPPAIGGEVTPADSDGNNRRSNRKQKSSGWKGRAKNKGSTTPTPIPDEPAPSAGGGHEGGRKRQRELPDCLNPDCDGKHFVDDCPKTTEEKKRELKKQYWEAKKARRQNKRDGKDPQGHTGGTDGHTGHIGRDDINGNSSLFSASFCNGAVEALALADQGSDGNIISPSILQSIIRAQPNIEVKQLDTESKFRNPSFMSPPIRCNREVQANILLRVRHGTNLMLRGLKWLVSADELEYAYIGRHVLSAIGINNEVLLAAASDRFGGQVNVPEALANDGHEDAPVATRRTTPSINSILAERGIDYGSTFHSHGGSEEDGLDDSEVYVDIGDDSEEELTVALERLVLDAKDNGMSENGISRLSHMLQKHRSVFDFGWEKPHQPTSSQ